MQQPRDLQPYAPDEHALALNKLRVVKDVIAPKCNDVELEFFLAVCEHTGLNPFARQIYAIKRGDKLTIQTSIDGYRAIAEKSGKYAGQLSPQWCDADGVWVDVWLKHLPPAAARVGVLRSDWKEPVWGIARYGAYQQESNPLWKKMPDAMLAKCAEALALRKAFPDAIGGVYTREEMEQADNDFAPMVDAEPNPPARHLPADVTPIRAVEEHKPEPDDTQIVLTPHMVRDRASKRGIVGPAWGKLWNECKGNLQRINDTLNEMRDLEDEPEQDDDAGLKEEDAALRYHGSDDDKEEALTSFADTFTDATPEQDVPLADAAWNGLRMRMAALGWNIEQQDAFMAHNAVHGEIGEYGPSDWHQIDEALQQEEATASQAHEYDLRHLPTGKANRRRS